MIEKEYKYLVAKDVFYKLLNKTKIKEKNFDERIQINYYYDTIEFSSYKAGNTIRVRQNEDGLKLQVKKNIKTSDYVTSKENCMKIVNLPNCIELNNQKHFMVGNLITFRTAFKFEDDTEIMFDHNYYLGSTDYEIEMEFKNTLSENVKLLFKFIIDNYQPNHKSKYLRFIESKNIQNKAIDINLDINNVINK